MVPSPTRHPFTIAPVTLLALALAMGVAVVVVVTLLAHQQPWLGLKLAPVEEGAGAVARAAKGPAAAIPPGTILLTIAAGEETMELRALDLTTEPDGALGDYATYRHFLERQEGLARLQRSDEVVFTDAEGQRWTVRPVLAGRPLADLPADFWVQCLVGLIAWLVSAAVFAFRRGEASARYLLLSGASTLLFAPAAAVYTTRELAVPGALLQWASDLNFLGGSLFAASFVGLLLVYPRRLAPSWVGPSVVTLYLGWFVAQQVGVFESMTFARRFLFMVGVGATFVLAAWHLRVSGHDPLARAKLLWFLLSWVVGTSAFALFILLPQAFGVDTSPIQGYAFLLFLLVYGGLAMGILRYRLFELGDWWRRIVGWVALVLLLVVLDLGFLYGLHLSTGTSLAIAFLICGFVWLPLRSLLWKFFSGKGTQRKPKDLFRQVMQIALAPDETQREQDWRALMGSVFEPLEITPGTVPAGAAVTIRDDGLSLQVPGLGPLEGLRLAYAGSGQRLFRPDDAALATELRLMLKHGLESLAAYQKGVAEERGRIARDMHDNIGAQLLSALHSRDAETKDMKIRETLADLRKVINATPDSPATLDETLADLRIETAERLEMAGMELCWQVSGDEQGEVSSAISHALRSIIREAVSNAIRHSGGRAVSVRVELANGTIRIEVSDDGGGFDPGKRESAGNGVANIRTRLEHLGGTFELRSDRAGTTLVAQLPTSNPSPRP